MTMQRLGFLGVMIVALLVCALSFPVLAVDNEPAKKGTDLSDRISGASEKLGDIDRPSVTSDHLSMSKVQRANELIGMEVRNPENENLGNIKEIVLNRSEDKVAYAVLRFGGFLGMGEKYFAVPWNALELRSADKEMPAARGTAEKPEGRLERMEGTVKEGYDAAKGRILGHPEAKKVAILDVNEEQLEQAPGFDKDSWPNMADPNWERTIASYYQKHSKHYTDQMKETEPARPETARADLEFRKVTEIVGLDIQGRDENSVGEVEDLVIDMPSGHVAYAIISVPGAEDKLAALPWNALKLDPEENVAMLDADPTKIDAYTFTEEQFPNFADRTYSRRLHEHFNTQPYWETSPAPGTVTREQAALEGRSPIAVPRLATQDTGTETGAAVDTTKPVGAAALDKAKTAGAEKTTTVSGTIMSVGQYSPGKGQMAGQRLRLRTDEGKMVTVHTCPIGFASRQGMDFSYGEKVTITGSKAEIDGKPVVLASEIRTDRDRFRTRDEAGRPEWQKPDTPSTGATGSESPDSLR